MSILHSDVNLTRTAKKKKKTVFASKNQNWRKKNFRRKRRKTFFQRNCKKKVLNESRKGWTDLEHMAVSSGFGHQQTILNAILKRINRVNINREKEEQKRGMERRRERCGE
jgi:hypothetical protein